MQGAEQCSGWWKNDGGTVRSMTFGTVDRHERAADALKGHPDYRILRRLMPVTAFHETDPWAPSRMALRLT